MSVKITGEEFKKFYSDDDVWPENVWHEDGYMGVDGIECVDGIDIDSLSDTSIVTISGGIVYGLEGSSGQEPTLETYFKRWKKKQDTAIFVVSCDKSIMMKVKSAIIEAGGKVG